MAFNFDFGKTLDLDEYANSKKVLLFLSGGADSLYLLLQDLLCGYTVVATHVLIKNNRNKGKRERKALNLLKEDIRKFCDHFKCKQPLYLGTQSIEIVGDTFGRCAAKQPIIFAMYSLLLGHGFDEIQMGIVQGDSMCGNRFNEAVAKVYKEHFITGCFPQITYPIEQVSKEAEYLTLKGYDDVLGTHFIEHITCCEKVDDPCGKNKECHPCQTKEAVFKRLNWKGENGNEIK